MAFEKLKEAFLNTKLNKRFWVCFLIGLFFTLFFAGLTAVSALKIATEIYSFISGNINIIAAKMMAQASLAEVFSPLVARVALWTALLGLVSFIVGIFYMSLVWRKSAGQKYRFTDLFKYLGLSVIYLLAISIIIGLSAAMFIAAGLAGFAPLVLALVLAHMYYVSVAEFAATGSFLSGLKAGFSKGLLKIYNFIPVYLIFLLIAAILAGFAYIIFPKEFIISILQQKASPMAVMLDWEIFLQQLKDFGWLAVKAILAIILLAVFAITYIRIFFVEFVRAIGKN